MRLIDANRLRDAFLGMPNCYNGFSDSYDKAMIVDMVDEQPTVDAVPVVWCKECRFYRFYDGTFGKGWMCFENNTARHGDDYCSRGERKDDE